MADRHPVFALADRFVDDLAAQSPTTASYLGIPGSDDRWDDTSPAGHDDMASLLRRYQIELKDLPGADDRWDRLALRVFGEQLELSLDPIDHGDHLHDLGHIQSLVPELRSVFELMDTSSTGGWGNVTARMQRLGEPLAGLRACLEAGRAQGLLAAKRQTRSIIDQLRAWTEPGGALFQLVQRHGAAADGTDDGTGARLSDGLAAAATASAELADWLEIEYLPHALDADGMGEERYKRAARAFLGTDLDLVDTYRWGWDQVMDLRAQMVGLAEQIQPGRSLTEVVNLLQDDPDRGAPTQAEFRDQMLARIEGAISDLDGSHFDIPDEIKPCDVRMAPAGAPLGAWFVPPSEDFTRPGTTWWSIGDREPVPLWDQVTTAYHEGFPGHHLQCGLQAYLKDNLTRVHRTLFWLPGYGEGWALYAERLMRELGYFEQPDYELGLLAMNSLRATRVAVDIGCHLGLTVPDDVRIDGEAFHPGESWSFDLAVEAVERFAFQPRDMAVSEVTRYLGWPGQAISYKVGERVILRLRDEARAAEGDRFDLRAFHQRVLGSGPVGLDHLRELVLAPA